MAWLDLDPDDNTHDPMIVECVAIAKSTARVHDDQLGIYTDQVAKQKLQAKMRPNVNGIRHLKIKTDDKFENNGSRKRFTLFFQKMKWMSEFGVRADGSKFGDVWILTVAFDDLLLPRPAIDNSHYSMMVNQIARPQGPLTDFLRDNNVRSLFIAGEWNDPDQQTTNRRITRFEWVAKRIIQIHQWSIKTPIKIDANYQGQDSNGSAVTIPGNVLGFWGDTFANQTFALTEIYYGGHL